MRSSLTSQSVARDIPKSVIVLSRFSRVASAKFEIFFCSKQHSIPLRNAHLILIATDPKHHIAVE